MLKKIMIRTIAVLMIMLGSLGAYVESGLVFDTSYMQTQKALGSPGDVTEIWLQFALTIVVAITGLYMLVFSFWRRRAVSKNAPSDTGE